MERYCDAMGMTGDSSRYLDVSTTETKQKHSSSKEVHTLL